MKKYTLISIILSFILTVLLAILLLKFSLLFNVERFLKQAFNITGIFIATLIFIEIFIYKFIKKILELKDKQDISATDFVFIVILCILLLVPISHTRIKDNSLTENRILKKYPSIIKKGEFNMNYGKDFNQWFSDRFNMRTELISLDATYKCILTKNYYKRNNIIFDKKNKVIYSNSFWGMNEIKKNKDKTFSAIAQKLERLNNYCKQNNIKLYLLIVPRRSDFVTVSKSNNQKHFDYGVELIEYLKKNTNVDIIYPYEELQQANKITPVYFKTDHHWSKKGAYIGYKALMNEIKKIYPDINIVNDENLEPYYHNLVNSTYQNIFTRGSLNKQLGLFNIYIDKFLDTPYMYYKNPEKRNFVIKNKANWPNFDPETDLDVYYEKGYDKKVLLLGDSFNINLIDFLPLSFKRVLLYPVNRRNMKFSRYENIIKIYKPDIIVITMRIFYLKNLNNLYDDNHKKGRLK